MQLVPAESLESHEEGWGKTQRDLLGSNIRRCLWVNWTYLGCISSSNQLVVVFTLSFLFPILVLLLSSPFLNFHTISCINTLNPACHPYTSHPHRTTLYKLTYETHVFRPLVCPPCFLQLYYLLFSSLPPSPAPLPSALPIPLVILLSAFFSFSPFYPLSMLELYLLSIQTARLNAHTLFDLPLFPRESVF